MNTTWRTEIPQLMVVLGMFAAAAILWPYAPESLPVHWNVRGEVDRYGGKFEGLLLLPIIAVGIYGLLLVIPRIDPGRANYQSFQSAYLMIRWATLAFLTVIYACMLLVSFKYPINIGAVVMIAIGVLFVVLGNVLSKIRPNWFVGVRTPWTLSSRQSWNKTHRLAGRVFVVMGLLFGMCGLVQTTWMLMIALGFTFISMAWIIIYSYLIWRGDTERLTPAAISPAQDSAELK